ncbi:MAG: S1C family serine protease, partial [Thermoproteota archaeon]|nr:S1C family serine protease [Thermoproteota archaeon]
MSTRDIVMLVTALSLAIVVVMQGSVFDTTRAMGVSLAGVAAAITHIQDDGKMINGNNPNQPLTPTNRQSTSDTIDTSFKNIALQSNTNDPTTQTTNLTAVFKQVENSVVQITARTPNPNLQVIINGNPLGGQSTRLGSGFVYDKQGHIITNSHVIDGATTADITFIDGNTYT